MLRIAASAQLLEEETWLQESVAFVSEKVALPGLRSKSPGFISELHHRIFHVPKLAFTSKEGRFLTPLWISPSNKKTYLHQLAPTIYLSEGKNRLFRQKPATT